MKTRPDAGFRKIHSHEMLKQLIVSKYEQAREP